MKRQRGLAAITAILIVAVAASAAALMLSQQSAMLDQTAMVAARAQGDAYAQAGLDWARGVLAQDAKTTQVDSLDEGWAVPIAALPIERAVVGGIIVDEQGKFDLNSLDGPSKDDARRIFRSLLGGLALAPDLAEAVIDWIDSDDTISGNSGAEDSYYLSLPRPYRAANRPMEQVEELYRVRGFGAATVARLRPFVSALPRDPVVTVKAVNVNTAPPAVLQALVPTLQPEQVARLATERRARPYTSKQAFLERLAKDGIAPTAVPSALIDVKSAYFSVRIHVAQDDVQLATEALVKRRDAGAVDIIWRRPRY